MPITILRWIARIGSVLAIAMLLLFLLGEGDFSEIDSITILEWIAILFFPLGVVVGMVVAWWRERLGGIITVSSLVAFYLLNMLFTGSFPGGSWFLIFVAPGMVFLLCGFLERSKSSQTSGKTSNQKP